jgi:hypothetical protein
MLEELNKKYGRNTKKVDWTGNISDYSEGARFKYRLGLRLCWDFLVVFFGLYGQIPRLKFLIWQDSVLPILAMLSLYYHTTLVWIITMLSKLETDVSKQEMVGYGWGHWRSCCAARLVDGSYFEVLVWLPKTIGYMTAGLNIGVLKMSAFFCSCTVEDHYFVCSVKEKHKIISWWSGCVYPPSCTFS